MAFAYNGPAWVELQPGQDFVEPNGTISSYGTVMNWSPQQRTAKGIKAVVDDEIPAGKVQTGSEVVDDAGTPRRVWTLEDAPPPPVPEPTGAQCKIALYEAGLLDDVEDAIAAHPYRPVQLWYASANTWRRDNPYVQAIGVELGLTDEQIDDLFRAAALKL